MANLFDLTHCEVIITGAAGLLGRQHVDAFLAAGASVSMLDVNDAALQTAREQWPDDAPITCEVVDITDESVIAAFVKRLQQRTDDSTKLVLVNNAAIDAKVTSKSADTNFSRLEHFALGQWEQELAVGLTGAMLMCKHVGFLMAQRGGGNIINVSSDLGVIAPNQSLYQQPDLAPHQQSVKPVTYSVIKHGLVGLTKYIATYWASQGVRCNAIAPGGMQVDQPAEFISNISKLIPAGRMAQHNEYQGAMVFLASDASAYMNGHTLVMDGGRSIW